MQTKILTLFYSTLFLVTSTTIVLPKTTPVTSGYWVDGYWDNTTQTWYDGYWVETPEQDCGYWVDGYWDGNTNIWYDGYWKDCYVQQNDSYIVHDSNYNYDYTNDSISIPDIGYSSNVYYDEYKAQEITDAWNSSYGFWMDGHFIIADHAYQGFKGIRFAPIGTIAYYTSGGTIATLQKVGEVQGYNTGYGLLVSDGSSIYDLYPNSVVMYTCNDAYGYNITITFWNYI